MGESSLVGLLAILLGPSLPVQATGFVDPAAGGVAEPSQGAPRRPIAAIESQSDGQPTEASSSGSSTPASVSRVILFVWDGTQRRHLLELYEVGQMTRLHGLVESGGLLRMDAVINCPTCQPGDGDGYDAETGPANTAIQTGYGSDVTGYVDNLLAVEIPEGLTLYERLKAFDPAVATGYVTSKDFLFWPTMPLANAFATSIDFSFQSATDNAEVANQAIAFLSSHHESPFFLTVHFRHPDEAGHDLGENSVDYDQELIGVDVETGRIVDELLALGIDDDTAVLITTDHGFGEDQVGVRAHEACDDDTLDLFLLGYPSWTVASPHVPPYQTSIAPTIFDLFGMDKDVDPPFPSESLWVAPASREPLFADGFESADWSFWS